MSFVSATRKGGKRGGWAGRDYITRWGHITPVAAVVGPGDSYICERRAGVGTKYLELGDEVEGVCCWTQPPSLCIRKA